MSSSTGSFSATPTLLNQKICDKKMKSNFKDQDTSLKTKSGVINDVNDGIYIVKCPDEEIYVDLSDLQYNFIKNDKVRFHFFHPSSKFCNDFLFNCPNFTLIRSLSQVKLQKKTLTFPFNLK